MLIGKEKAYDFSRKSRLVIYQFKELIEEKLVTTEYLKYQWKKENVLYNFHFRYTVDRIVKEARIELSEQLFERKENELEALHIANEINNFLTSDQVRIKRELSGIEKITECHEIKRIRERREAGC